MRIAAIAEVGIATMIALALATSAETATAREQTAGAAKRPMLTSVTVTMPAAGGAISTPVVWRGNKAWFSLTVENTMYIYAWQASRWSLAGTAALPKGMPTPFIDGSVGVISATRGAAPDFTTHFVGADTWWLAVIARLAGRWQVVPFDDQFNSRDPYTFAFGTRSPNLIEGIFDSCGCAGGPTTFQWYRFSRIARAFEPTPPPGRSAPCTRDALKTAMNSYVIPGDPIVERVKDRSDVHRFACSDGWAVATDGTKLSIYEQGSGRRTAYDPGGGRWLRVGVGSPTLASREIDFAMSRSLLVTLGRRVGVVIPPNSKQPLPLPRFEHFNSWQRSRIAVNFFPGELDQGLYYTGNERPKILTIRVIAPRGVPNRLIRFRWQDGRWVRVR